MLPAGPEKSGTEERTEMLKIAIESGATYVDIEYEAPDDYRNDMIEFAHSHQCDVIISYHNYERTPELDELEKIVHNCFEHGS